MCFAKDKYCADSRYVFVSLPRLSLDIDQILAFILKLALLLVRVQSL